MSKYDELDYIEWLIEHNYTFSDAAVDLVKRRQDLMCEIAMADW